MPNRTWKYAGSFGLSVFLGLASAYSHGSAGSQNGKQSSDSVSQANKVQTSGSVTGLPDSRELERRTSLRGPYRTAESSATTPGLRPRPEKVNRCASPKCRYDTDTVLVKLKPESSLQRLSTPSSGPDLLQASKRTRVFSKASKPRPGEQIRTAKGQLKPKPDLTRWHKISLPSGVSPEEALDMLENDLRVETAEFNLERSLSIEPDQPVEGGAQISAISHNDPGQIEQWHLNSANVPAAWQWLDDNGYEPGGDRNVVVAVIDTGVDYNHEDLAINMWVNAGEIPGNGVDDDSNGFVDDIHGATVIGSSGFHSGDPMDDHGHGTHVAGIIAAQADNNLGGVGVAYNVQIMAIKAAQYSGVLTTADIAEAVYYAYEQGADVINMSFGGTGVSQVEEDALASAFGQAVLVASAGNSGLPNEDCLPLFGANYPAAYNWVLGVMAEAPTANPFGDYLASFSSWDCQNLNSTEYEVMAPGVDIYSSLPLDGYSAWDGTSMAAPIVSGIAALLRTRFSDKMTYSSRFLMGQLSSTGSLQQGKTVTVNLPAIQYYSSDALAALTSTPTPQIAYLEHWLWDEAATALSNDDDGIVDAGETIDLAVVVRNYWGQAENVQISIEALAEGSVTPDPYISWNTSVVDYGSIGSFSNDDNGITHEEGGLVTGVEFPFQFLVDPATPNNHIIPLKVTISANNGLDPADPTVYSFVSRFGLVTQRGTQLPRIISGDDPGDSGADLDTDGRIDGVITLDKNTRYIVDQPVLIEEGVTLRAGPGVEIQWWGSQPDDTYAVFESSFLQVEGDFLAAGTHDDPVILAPSDLFPDRAVVFKKPEQDPSGTISLSYVRASNLFFSSAPGFGDNRRINDEVQIDHSVLDRVASGTILVGVEQSGSLIGHTSLSLAGVTISNSRLQNLGIGGFPGNCSSDGRGLGGVLMLPNSTISNSIFDSSLFDLNLSQGHNLGSLTGNVFLGNNYKEYTCAGEDRLYSSLISNIPDTKTVSGNAILNPWIDLETGHWIFLNTAFDDNGNDQDVDVSGNYWGTDSRELIDIAVRDYQEDFSQEAAIIDPILSSPPVTLYPFVEDVELLDGASNPRPDGQFGAEAMIWRVTFNRDMDPATQPNVSYGPQFPYTDFPILGDWLDARTWEGQVNISPVANDGYQYVRVQGAVAAGDAWLVTGNDYARYRFEVITSGASALNLQAAAGEGYVDLSWTQDDFETLHGFNLYRSTSPNSGFIRIHQSLIGHDIRDFRDDNVLPGVTYHYQFKVVTELGESDPSNTASATPNDTVAPVLTHTPVSTSPYGGNVLIQATATDNISVQDVTLYHRATGDSTYNSVTMVNSSGNDYAGSIPGVSVTDPGVEYYIEATDGASSASSGHPATPHVIAVSDSPVVTNVSPNSGPSDGGTLITIAGANFKDGIIVDVGGIACTPVTFVSSTQLKCTTAASAPSLVTVRVTNPDAAMHNLTGAFTYLGGAVSGDVGDIYGIYGETLHTPVNISGVSGLGSIDAVITYDPAHLQLVGVHKGSFISSWSFASHEPSAGTINIAGASSTGAVNGSGEIAVLEFIVLSDQESTSGITLTSLSLNDGAIASTVDNGSFTFFAGYTLSGVVTYWGGSQQGVAASVRLNELDAAISNASTGSYQIDRVDPGANSVSVQKNDEAEGITAYDASLILMHSVGSITLGAEAQVAADVNDSGAISGLDAFEVLSYVARLSTLPFSNQAFLWQFTPQPVSFPNLDANQSSVDFTAILMGETSGNWAPIAVNAQSDLDAAYFHNRSEISPGRIGVDLCIDPAAMDVSGAEFLLSFSSGADFVQLAPYASISSWSIVVNEDTPDEIRIAMAGSSAVSAEQCIASLQFDVADNAQLLSLQSGLLNETSVSTVSAVLFGDEDNDDMQDSWELGHSLDPTNPADATLDSDADNLSNIEEFRNGTDPRLADTDGDGLDDGYEIDNGLDPLDGVCPSWICGGGFNGWRVILQENR